MMRFSSDYGKEEVKVENLTNTDSRFKNLEVET